MSAKYLDNIRDLLCAVCGKPNPDPHHLLRGLPQGERGVGRKASDRWCIPLCREHHDEAHATGDDEKYLAEHGIQGRELASALWAARESLDSMVRVLLRALQERMRKAMKGAA